MNAILEWYGREFWKHRQSFRWIMSIVVPALYFINDAYQAGYEDATAGKPHFGHMPLDSSLFFNPHWSWEIAVWRVFLMWFVWFISARIIYEFIGLVHDGHILKDKKGERQ